MSSGGLGNGETKMKDHIDEPKKIQGGKPSFNFNKSTIKNNPAVQNQIWKLFEKVYNCYIIIKIKK